MKRRQRQHVTHTVAAVLIAALIAASLSGCDLRRAGARCSRGFARDATNVLICRSGRWRPLMTIHDYLMLLSQLQQAAAVEGATEERPAPAPVPTVAPPATPAPTQPTIAPPATPGPTTANPTTPTLPDIARSLTLLSGTTAAITVPVTGLVAVTSIATASTSPDVDLDVSTDLVGSPAATGVEIAVTAALSAPGQNHAAVEVHGCTQAVDPCPSASRVTVQIILTITVTPPTSAIPTRLPEAADVRWTPNPDGSATLPNELFISAADGVDGTQIAALVVANGGGMTGSWREASLYQARFAQAATAAPLLRSSRLVRDVRPVVGQAPMLDDVSTASEQPPAAGDTVDGTNVDVSEDGTTTRSTDGTSATSMTLVDGASDLKVVDAAAPAGAVEAGSRRSAALVGDPADWSDDGDDAKWTFRQAGADQAWRTTTGSTSVHLGIVDSSIYPDHSDLNAHLAYPDNYEAAFGSRLKAWKESYPHGTHVAGTMCLADGNGGLVGVSQQCTLHALDLGGPSAFVPWENRMALIEAWLRANTQIRVVNMSFSLVGAHPGNKPECSQTVTAEQTRQVDNFFKRFSNTLFVVAGGNCGGGGLNHTGTKRSVSDSLPAAVAANRSNVVSVSATRKKTTAGAVLLAEYSARDGEIAAPGGDDANPVWSTIHSKCGPDWLNRPRCDSNWAGPSSSWVGPDPAKTPNWEGTSMAAPFVSGTAGLMLAVNPTMTAGELALCLKAAATTATDVSSVREIWVPKALDCAQAAPLRITTPQPAFYQAGDAVDFQVSAIGGTAPYSYGVSSALPTDWPDISFVNGHLTGHITSTLAPITFTATDSIGRSTSRSYTFGPAAADTVVVSYSRLSGPAGVQFRIDGRCPVSLVPVDAADIWVVIKFEGNSVGWPGTVTWTTGDVANRSTGRFSRDVHFDTGQGMAAVWIECRYTRTHTGDSGVPIGTAPKSDFIVTTPPGVREYTGEPISGSTVSTSGRCAVPSDTVVVDPYFFMLDDSLWGWDSDAIETTARLDGSFGPVSFTVPTTTRPAELRIRISCRNATTGDIVYMPETNVGRVRSA